MTPGPQAAYLTALAIGALHGLEPGHGWPVAAVYALGRPRRWSAGFLAGVILGGAHLVSSFAVVAGFALVDRWLDVTRWSGLTRVAGVALMVMGAVQWFRSRRDHRHHHDGAEERVASGTGLAGLAAFAFVLGFAHEEEFAILALCAGRASCWGVMAAYAVTVAAAILGLTLASIAAYQRFRERIDPWHDRIPRASAVVLLAMGAAYLLGWI